MPSEHQGKPCNAPLPCCSLLKRALSCSNFFLTCFTLLQLPAEWSSPGCRARCWTAHRAEQPPLQICRRLCSAWSCTGACWSKRTSCELHGTSSRWVACSRPQLAQRLHVGGGACARVQSTRVAGWNGGSGRGGQGGQGGGGLRWGGVVAPGAAWGPWG